MTTWTFRVRRDVTFTVDNQQLRLVGGDPARNTYTSSDPCQFMRALAAAQAQLPASERGVRNETPRAVQEARAACEAQHAAGQPAPPVESSQPQPVDPNPSPPAADGNRETDQTPATVGAPQPQVAGEVSRDGHRPGERDERRVGDQLRDPQRPRTDQEVADELASRGTDPAQIPQELEDGRRNRPPPGEPHPDFAHDQRRPLDTVADPVVIFSGEFLHAVTDVEIASVGFPLRFERTYRSGAVQYGPFGYQWDHNYDVYLRVLTQDRIAVWTARSAEDIYKPAPAGGYEPPLGVFRRLEWRAADGVRPDRWVLSDPGGLSLVFQVPLGWPHAARIPLTSIEDAAGNVHRLTYDPEGRLARVTDEAGRFLAFEYGDCGLLERLFDHTNRAWRYDHHPESEHLTRVTAPGTPDYPTGRTTTYVYDRYNPHPARQHDLLAIVDANDLTVVENEYGQDPMSLDFGRVIHQEFAGFASDLSATELQVVPHREDTLDVPAIRVEVIDPGFYFVYTFNWRGDLLDKRYRLVVDGSYRLVASTYRYDRQGNLTERYDADGRGVVYEYDHANVDPRARGNLLRVTARSSPLSPAPAIELARASYEPALQQLKSFRDAEGAVTELVYDYETGGLPPGRGLVRRIRRPPRTRPDGTVVATVEELAYNARGQLIEHRVDGCVHQYEYGPTGYLRQRTHTKAGVVLRETFEHDALGNVTARIDGEGNRQEYAVDATGRVQETRLPDGSTWRFAYDAGGRLAAAIEPRGRYDDAILAGAPIRHELRWDVLGHLVEEVRGANTIAPRRIRYKRTAEGNLEQIDDATGRIVRRVVDERGLVLSETIADAAATVVTRRDYRYTKIGQLERVVTGGAATELAYDGFGRLRSVVGPDGTVARYDRDRRGDVIAVEVTGRQGGPGTPHAVLARRRYERDEVGQVRRELDALFAVPGGPVSELATTYARDDAGDIVQLVTPRGLVVEREYGPFGLCVHERGSLGGALRVVFDGAGREVRREVLDGAIVLGIGEVAYDPTGRVRLERDALGNEVRYEHDARGVPWRMTNPRGMVLERAANAFDEIVAQHLAGWTTRWERDPAGRVRAFVDPTGTATRFDYDVADRMTSVIRADGARQRYGYEPSGALTSFEDFDGTRVDYASDPTGLPVKLAITPAPGVAPTPPIALAWDGLRRLVAADHDGAVHSFDYDSLGRLLAERGTHSVTLAYDPPGTSETLTYPDGRRDRREHDALGRPTRVLLDAPGAAPLPGFAAGDELARFGWRGADELASIVAASTLTTELRHDAAGRLVGMRAAAGASIHEETWALDALGLRRADLRIAPVASVREVDYDDLTRLARIRRGLPAGTWPAGLETLPQAQRDAALAALAAAPATTSTTWSYLPSDTPARRTDRDAAGVVTADHVFTADALHQIASRDGTAIAHSASGNLVAFGARRYLYDGLRRLVGVEVGGVPVLHVRYDALGRVRERTEAGVTHRFTYLRDELLQIDGPTRIQRVPSPLLDRPVLESSPVASHLLAHDGLGSLVAACAVDGSVVERYVYDEFGAPTIVAPDGVTARAASAIGRAPAFQGHTWLPGAALYDVRNRVYDPSLQIFLQPDPIAFSGSWSHHGFVRYNPLSYVDPFGAFWHIVAGAVIGAAIGGIGAALSGGDWRDVLVGIGAGAVGGGLTAAGFPVAGGAIAGALQGAWSGGRAGYRMGGTRGAVLGALGGAALGAGLGAVGGGIASRVSNRIATPLYGAVFNAALRRGLSGAATANVARYTSMTVSGYAGGVAAGTFGNVGSTVALDIATGRPVTWDQLRRAGTNALTVDGPLNAFGAAANRFAYVSRFRGNASNRLGFEGEGLTGRAIGYEPTNGTQRIIVNGNERRPDFDTNATLPERNAVFEVKNKQALSTDDVAQIGDFAQHAAAAGGDLHLYHRPGMDLTPVGGIGNLRPFPIPQQPLVVTVPQPIRDRSSTK